MALTRARVLTASLLLLLAGAGGFAYYKYSAFSAYLGGQLSGRAAVKLGRQIRFESVSFSPLRGIVIRKVCVSRRPDFSKGSFFCAEEAVVRPSLPALLRNRVYFASVSLEKPVLKTRERDGKWDFDDLLALLPETDKGLHLTWNVSELIMKDAVLEADLETSGLSAALEDADLKLEHYSSYGGHFGLEAEGRVKTVHGGKLVTCGVEMKSDANFEYGGLSSAKGRFSAEDVAYGAVTLGKFRTDWDLFNLRKPVGEKNYTVSLRAENLLVPAQEGPVRDAVAGGLRLFSAAMGRPAPRIEDIEVASLRADLRLNDSVLAIKDVSLRANFLNLDASLHIDGPARASAAALKAEIGPNRLELSAEGPLRDPEIKPLLSATLSAQFKSALAAIQAGLLRTFPVTGE